MCKLYLTDEDVLKNEGTRRAYEILSERYTGRVIALARTFTNADDDLIEEGLIALFRAIETYDETKGAKFSTYAYACIRNRISDAAKKRQAAYAGQAARVGQAAYAGQAAYVGQAARVGQAVQSLEAEVPTETDFTAVEVKTALNNYINQNLTKLEGDIFRLRQSGMSYTEIAKLRGISEKSVDNAYFRAKSKLKKIFQNIE